jgi:4-hydroxy-2-oxoheptanedioate aldolase
MRTLRDELDRRPLWGAFICSNSALAAEFMAQAGFDWLVIDLQHSPTGGSEQLAAMLRATGSTPTLVRIPWKTDYGTAMASAVEKLGAGNGRAG